MAPALITDSASALTIGSARALGIHVVSLRVMMEGRDFPDLAVDSDWFYRRLAAGAAITTSQPSPGDLLAAYRAAAEAGAESAWSIHIGSALSGTLGAASVAAQASPIPVRLVDSGTASMPEGLGVLAALQALREDPTADVEAVVVGETSSQANVFVSLSPSVLEHSGRANVRFSEPLPVLSLRRGEPIEVVGSVRDMNQAVELMAGRIRGLGQGLTVAVGEGGSREWGEALIASVEEMIDGAAILRYAVPPSVGAHAGPTVGLVISQLMLSDQIRASLVSSRRAFPQDKPASIG